MKNKLNPVAMTSLLVAAMRAAETNRSETEGRLFSDPYAELLAGSEGMELRLKAIEAVGDQPAIAIRTAFIDEKINKALNLNFRQIVILASGMDSRAYRLNFPKGTKVFECDQADVLKYKREKLKELKPRCEHFEIEVDLRENWKDLLCEKGFNNKAPTLWIVEGLLMYLKEEEVMSLINQINLIANKNDILLFDIFTRFMLEAPHMQKQLEFLTKLGAPWTFGTNDPEEFMRNLGWSTTLTQAGEFSPSRWPYPVAPKTIPNLPRSFFVEAIKI
jgi:methyltransferase (TIGR00027 family)